MQGGYPKKDRRGQNGRAGLFSAMAKRLFASDCAGWETRFYQPAVPFVMTGFPSASNNGVNPPAYPLTIKR